MQAQNFSFPYNRYAPTNYFYVAPSSGQQTTCIYPVNMIAQSAPAVFIPPVIPDSNLINQKLNTHQAIQTGVQQGLLYGVLGSIPIWGLERLSGKKSLFQEVFDASQKSLSPLARTFRTPGGHYIATLASTSLLGILVGGGLGWWMVGHVKNRLLEINRVQQAQALGCFQAPLSPSWLQRLGLKDQPVTDPNAAYQQLLAVNLNPATAFMQGVKDVLILKVLKGLIPLLGFVGYLLLSKRISAKNMDGMMKQRMDFLAKTMLHPVFLAKLAMLPLIGGLLAHHFVPWMRAQLNISEVEGFSEARQTAFRKTEAPVLLGQAPGTQVCPSYWLEVR